MDYAIVVRDLSNKIISQAYGTLADVSTVLRTMTSFTDIKRQELMHELLVCDVVKVEEGSSLPYKIVVRYV